MKAFHPNYQNHIMLHVYDAKDIRLLKQMFKFKRSGLTSWFFLKMLNSHWFTRFYKTLS